MPKPKKSRSPVERMIVVAIIGILMSVILPNLQRSSRRARTTRPRTSTHAVQRHSAPDPAGQLNTIEVSRTAAPGAGGDRRNPAHAIGVLVRLFVVVGIVMAVAVAIKQGMRRAQQHGP
jgi:type II secretory pathway pseudopilin PulG